MFYVYEWYNEENGEIFYVGKGTKRRYKVLKHNKFFNDFVKRYKCNSRIIKYFENEQDAFNYEYFRIEELKSIGQCACNIYEGGFGGTVSWWTEEKRNIYSQNNVMKNESQRHRMSVNNPMSNDEIAKKVGYLHKKKVCIDDTVYDGLIDVANAYNVSTSTVQSWIKKGYSNDFKPCYLYGTPKPKVKRRTHNLNGIKIYIDDNLFESIKAAAKFLNTTPYKLRKQIDKNGKYENHICRYGNQQPNQKKPIKVF